MLTLIRLTIMNIVNMQIRKGVKKYKQRASQIIQLFVKYSVLNQAPLHSPAATVTILAPVWKNSCRSPSCINRQLAITFAHPSSGKQTFRVFDSPASISTTLTFVIYRSLKTVSVTTASGLPCATICPCFIIIT